jgi:subfamily B ATP-binding cassette protein MsbA
LYALSILAMVVYASLDAFSFTLLIPFLNVLFGSGQAAGAFGGAIGSDTQVDRILEWVVGDVITRESPMAALRNVVLVMFGAFLAKNLASYLYAYSTLVVEGRITRDIRNTIYAHLLRLGFPFFQKTRSGQIIGRVTADVDQMRSLVTSNLSKALASALQVTFYLTALLLLSWKLAAVAMLSLPPMLLLWARFRKRLHAGVMHLLDVGGDLSARIQETVGGIRLVKVSGAEAWENERFRELTHRHYKAMVRNERWRQFFPPATEMIIATSVLGILWYGSYLVLAEGSLGAPAFLAFLALAMRLMQPIKALGSFPSTVQPGLAAGARAFQLLDTIPEIDERPDARPVTGFRDALRFENVTFAYGDGEPVLREVNLEIQPGDVVALVGPSGAGKSTLADFVPRFHDPTQGRVTLDGVDLRELRLPELRNLFGIVTQETILFHDTVRANIAYGRPNATQVEVEAAARAAHAHGFVAALPAAYDTMLGERGVRLSGGQRQRIAIARALLRQPPFLVLDEATSALDTESERAVQQAVDELMRDHTVLVIAHRLSTVRRADRIVVMDEGRIVQCGTHEVLLAEGGLYRRLYRMQFATEDEVYVA